MLDGLFVGLQELENEAGLIDLEEAATNISEHLEIPLGRAYDMLKQLKGEAKFDIVSHIDVIISRREATQAAKASGRVSRQHGGPLGDITEVGEGGPEGIIGDTVIPTHLWRQLKRLGIMPSRKMMVGGTYDPGSTYTPPPSKKDPTLLKTTIPKYKTYTPIGYGGSISGTAPVEEPTQITPTISTIVAQSTTAVNQQAAAQADFTQSVTTSMTNQTKATDRIGKLQADKLDEVIGEIRQLREDLPRAVRDAVLLEVG